MAYPIATVTTTDPGQAAVPGRLLSLLSALDPRLVALGWSLTLLAVAWVGAAVFLLLWARHRKATGPADVIVVPGAKVEGDTLSPVFALRVHEAAALYLAGVAPRVVVSGAGGEAQAGAALARQLGVPEPALREEPDALNTVENAGYTRLLLPDVRRVVVVTNTSHLLRCTLAFQRCFPEVEPHDAGRMGFKLALIEVASLLRHPRRVAAWERLLANELATRSPEPGPPPLPDDPE